MEELKCPHCGSLFVEIEDCFDSQYNGDSIIRKCCGFCMDCGTPLVWNEVFEFMHYNNIEIDS